MIVQAHGHFDLLHYGHFKHLREASRLGYLVVTLTAGRFMSKPGHPIFTDDERLEMIASLRYVSEVQVVDSAYPYEAIDLVNPDIYVKGVEYRGVLPEYQYCVDKGIEVRFIGDKLYGSTVLAKQSGILQSA